MITVRRNAWRAAGVVTESQAVPKPFSNVRQKIIATGNASSSAR
jgi:hypothetical protein